MSVLAENEKITVRYAVVVYRVQSEGQVVRISRHRRIEAGNAQILPEMR